MRRTARINLDWLYIAHTRKIITTDVPLFLVSQAQTIVIENSQSEAARNRINANCVSVYIA